MTQILCNALLAGTLIAAIGCSREDVPRTVHESANDVVYAPMGPPASVARLDTVYANQRSAIEAARARARTATPDLRSQSVSELKEILRQVGLEFVLNRSYIRRPDFTVSLRMRNLLFVFNSALWTLHELAPSELLSLPGDPEVPGDTLIDAYSRAARDGCDSEGRGCNPTSADFFRTDGRGVSRALQIKARRIDERLQVLADGAPGRTELLLEYYSLLERASDLSNGSRDPRWQLSYMKRVRELAAYLSSQPPSSRVRDRIAMHGRQFDRISRDYQPRPNDPEFLEFVEAFQPWTRSRLRADVFPWGVDRMFSFAASNLLYAKPDEPAGTCGLNASLYEAIQKSQSETDISGPSFRAEIAALRSAGETGASAVDLIRNLGVKEVDSVSDACFFDEYFYMVDRLYRGHLNLDEVVQIWQGSRRNEAKLLATANFYMRIMVLKMVLETNQYMRGFYDRQQFNSQNLVRRVILESKALSDRWTNVLDRFETVGTFLGRSTRTGNESRRAYDLATVVRDSIKRNIKMIAVESSQMILAYFMSDTRANITINAWFWTITISADTVIEAMLEGRLIPWFSFGTDNVPLSKIEVIYSFYYALATGTFETFSVARDAEGKPAVTRKRFFQQVIRKYLQKSVGEVEQLLIGAREADSAGGDLETVRRACANLRAGNLDFTITLNSDDAPNVTFMGGGGVSGITRAAQATYERREGIRKIREEVAPRLAVVRSMVALLEANYRESNAPRAEVDETLGEIRQYLAQVSRTQLEYNALMTRQHREFGPCLSELAKIERTRIFDAIRAEKVHLGLAWDALSSPELAQLSPAAKTERLTEIGRQLGFSNGYDKLEPDAYSYTQMDFLLRNARRLETMRPSTRTQFPPDLTRITSWSKSYRLNLRAVDGSIKPRAEFIAEGIRNLSGKTGTFVNWLSSTTSLDARTARIRTLIDVYRAGLELGAPEAQRLTADEVIDEVLARRDEIALRPDEIELMRELNLQQRVPLEQIRNDVLFNASNGEPLGLLETPFRGVIDNIIKRADAEAMAKAMLTMEHLLFAPSTDVEMIIRGEYRPMILNVDNGEIGFDEAIKRREAAGMAASERRFTFGLDAQGQELVYEIPLSQDQRLQLVPPTVRRDYAAKIANFHLELAGNYFRDIKPGDPECAVAEFPIPACVRTNRPTGRR